MVPIVIVIMIVMPPIIVAIAVIAGIPDPQGRAGNMGVTTCVKNGRNRQKKSK